MCVQKIYGLSPQFFDNSLQILGDAFRYVYSTTPVIMSNLHQYATSYINVTRNFMEESLEKSHIWMKDKM